MEMGGKCQRYNFTERKKSDKIPSLTVEKIKNCCKSNVYRLYGSLATIFKI